MDNLQDFWEIVKDQSGKESSRFPIYCPHKGCYAPSKIIQNRVILCENNHCGELNLELEKVTWFKWRQGKWRVIRMSITQDRYHAVTIPDDWARKISFRQKEPVFLHYEPGKITIYYDIKRPQRRFCYECNAEMEEVQGYFTCPRCHYFIPPPPITKESNKEGKRL
jgi:hypothetical protein